MIVVRDAAATQPDSDVIVIRDAAATQTDLDVIVVSDGRGCWCCYCSYCLASSISWFRACIFKSILLVLLLPFRICLVVG